MERSEPKDGIFKEDAEMLLDQVISKQISRSDFWYALGFDFDVSREVIQWGGNKLYLINPKKPDNAAHIFIDGDTACHMLSTGGLGYNQKFVTSGSPEGRKVCFNCLTAIQWTE